MLNQHENPRALRDSSDDAADWWQDRSRTRCFLVSVDDQRKRLRELARDTQNPRKRSLHIDLSPIGLLLKRIMDTYLPEQVWLFGSRARGDARPWSDWDLFVVLPDAAAEQLLDPVRAFKLQKGSGVYADVIPCRVSDFRDNRGVVNTICHAVATEGMIIYER